MTSNVKRISTGYKPRPLQEKLHRDLRRFSVVVAHRRFGKSVFAVNEMIDTALRCPHPYPRVAYLAPTYSQAKRIVWDMLKLYSGNIPGMLTNEADLRIDIPRPHLNDHCRLMVLGAENWVALKGIGLDLGILDEFAEMSPSAWREAIRPTLVDRKGRAIFIGTPRGHNEFYELYQHAISGSDPEWYGAIFRATETGIISEKELESLKREMSEEEFEQEFLCSFQAGMVGAYFSKELAKAEREGRVTKLQYDPMLPVDTYWDLGINDTTSIWFVQSFRGRHRVLKYLEFCGLGIPEIVAAVKREPYALGEWVFPHDANVRDFSTGKARLQVFHSLGCRPTRVIPRVGNKMDSINAARMIFNLCEFDAAGCELGLKMLAQYQRKWNAKNSVFEDAPLHNNASNAADAFQQFGMGAGEESRATTSYDRRFHDGSAEIKADGDFNPLERIV